jgi:hypothetical protein
MDGRVKPGHDDSWRKKPGLVMGDLVEPCRDIVRTNVLLVDNRDV